MVYAPNKFVELTPELRQFITPRNSCQRCWQCSDNLTFHLLANNLIREIKYKFYSEPILREGRVVVGVLSGNVLALGLCRGNLGEYHHGASAEHRSDGIQAAIEDLGAAAPLPTLPLVGLPYSCGGNTSE